MAGGPYILDRDQVLDDETDAFGHRDYARALVHALTQAGSPFTVGLFGAWGLGKSTVLRNVQVALEDHDVTYVYFDAWRYEGEAFRREFLKDVATTLHERKALDKKKFDVEADIRDVYETVAVPEETVQVSKGYTLKTALVLAGLVLALYVAGVLGTDLVATKDSRDPPVVGFLALLPLIIFMLNKGADIVQVRQLTVTRERLEEPERFTQRFGQMLAAVKAKRLVIAIDNLDRLAADDAVALLSTVKTYLEPAIEPADEAPLEVKFLIAADESALREHLMTRAPQAAGGPDSTSQRKAERYADEYLRKFFNARLTIWPILGDDMRDYVRDHLRALAIRRDCEDSLEDLVRLCSAGLRNNPRGVKQFVNDLELQLQLVEAREGSHKDEASRIEPPISGNVTVVCKLLLIETQWPRQYEDLRDHPGRLAEWHRDAMAKERPERWLGQEEDWEEFRSLLIGSAFVRVENLRPYLRLKRSKAEAALPAYDRFHQAITTSRGADAVDALVSEGPGLIGLYARRVRDIVEESLGAGEVSAAVAAVENMLLSTYLREESHARDDLMLFVADEPDLLAGMASLPPRSYAEAALEAALGDPRLERLVDVLLGEYVLTVEQEIQDAASELIDAVATIAGKSDGLREHQKDRLRENIASETRRDHFEIYRRIVEADNDLLAAAPATRGLEDAVALMTQEGAETTEWWMSDAWAVMVVGLENGRAEGQERFLDAAGQVLNARQIQPPGMSAVCAAGMKVSAHPDSWIELLSTIQEGREPDVLDLAVHANGEVPEDRQATSAGRAAAIILTDPVSGAQYLEEHLDALPESLRGSAATELANRIGSGADPDLAPTVVRLREDMAPQLLRDAAINLAGSGQPEPATRLLDEQDLGDTSDLHRLGQQSFARIDQNTASDADYRLLSRLVRRGDTRSRDGVEDRSPALVQFVPKSPELQELLSVTVASRTPDDENRLSRSWLTHIEANDVPTSIQQLTVLTEVEAALTAAERESIVSRMTHWVENEPARADSVAPFVARLRDIPTDRAPGLVQALVSRESERDEDETDGRQMLLTAAYRVVDGTNSAEASTILAERVEELRRGNEHDKTVLGAVDASRAEWE